MICLRLCAVCVSFFSTFFFLTAPGQSSYGHGTGTEESNRCPVRNELDIFFGVTVVSKLIFLPAYDTFEQVLYTYMQLKSIYKPIKTIQYQKLLFKNNRVRDMYNIPGYIVILLS